MFEHQDCREGGLRWGVEPICAVLSQELGVRMAPSTWYEQIEARPCRRELTDGALKPLVKQVHVR